MSMKVRGLKRFSNWCFSDTTFTIKYAFMLHLMSLMLPIRVLITYLYDMSIAQRSTLERITHEILIGRIHEVSNDFFDVDFIQHLVAVKLQLPLS